MTRPKTRLRWVAVNTTGGECEHYHQTFIGAAACARAEERYHRRRYNERQNWYTSPRLLIDAGEYILLANLGDDIFLIQRRARPRQWTAPKQREQPDMPF